MKRVLLVAVLPLFPLLAGCIAKYQAVGTFDDHNEVFLGNITHNLITGTADITAKGEVTGMVCSGTSRVTSIPNPLALNCAGQRGVADLTCTDGRIISVDWVAESCIRGYGRGKDQNGNTFTLAFGMNEKQARAVVEKETQRVAKKPELPKVYEPGKAREEKGFATGTGFLVSDNGIIITNYHVIEDSSDLSVVDLFAGKKWPAKVLRRDAKNDIAVLKVEASNRPFLPLNYQAQLRKGEDVVALGYPMVTIQGQEQKATFGRINALSGGKNDERFLQMDAPIQPGNSGGPLLNNRGEVIGVNTQTISSVFLFKEQGILPQNVNYSVKIAKAMPTIQSAFSDLGLSIPSVPGMAFPSMVELVEKCERAVVLIIAK